MRKMLLIAIAAIVLIQPSQARQLSPKEAYNFAMRTESASNSLVKGLKSTMSSAQEPELVHTVETDSMPTVYVYQKRTGGFIIVAANDAVSTGLLAFAEKGEFDADCIPENVSMWLEHYGQQVAYAASQEADEVSVPEHVCSEKRHCVQPLMFTRWGQASPYNALCPEIGGKRTVVGCVATAMAQVMTTHQWPKTGVGSISYISSGATYSQDFSATTFDWESIVADQLRAPKTDEAKQAVAELMKSCGYSVKMTYGTTSSSSTLMSASRALVNYFNYDKGVSILGRDYFDDVTWDDMIYNEIISGRPVLYSGVSNVSGGHAFVCDGYDCSGYFHFNWGWNGSYDGYFLLTALDPYKNNDGFDYNENIVIGIQPPVEGNETRPIIQFSTGLTMTSTTTNVTIKCDNGIFNQSTEKLTFTFGAKLINIDTNEEMYLKATKKTTLIVGQATKSYTIPVSSFPKEGTWIVIPAILTEGGQWYDILIKRSYEYSYILDNYDGQKTFMPTSEAMISMMSTDKPLQAENLELLDRMMVGAPGEISAEITNKTRTYYEGDVFPVLFKDGECVAWGTKIDVDLNARSKETFVWQSQWDNEIEAGEYTMALADADLNVISDNINVVIESRGVETSSIEDIETDQDILYTEIYNMSGQIVLSYEKAQQVRVHAGVYVLHHHLADGSVRTQKVILR